MWNLLLYSNLIKKPRPGSRVINKSIFIETIYETKLEEYNKDIKAVKELFPPNIVCKFQNQDNVWEDIIQRMKDKKKPVA